MNRQVQSIQLGSARGIHSQARFQPGSAMGIPPVRQPQPENAAECAPHESGLTLIELMAVAAILAVLVGVALPAFNGYSQRTYRSEAQGDLLACALGMERWASSRFSYRGAADSDGDGVADSDGGAVSEQICAPRSTAEGRYEVRVVGGVDGFQLSAHPLPGTAMAGDGFLSLDEAGNRGWDRNNDAQITAAEEDWSG